MSKMKNFLWYSYFGITFEDAKNDKKKAQEKCMLRAYRDFCRTLRYSKIDKALDRVENASEYIDCKKVFIEEEKDYIADRIKVLLSGKKDFDEWHKVTCDGIIKIAKLKKTRNDRVLLKEEFSYGQAQKWLNMTLKYMLLMGLWDEHMQKIEDGKEPMHVPVDAYIIKAAKQAVKTSERKKWKCLNSSEEGYEESWSKWSFKQYDDFQKSMRKHIKEQKNEKGKQKYKTPLDWEQEKWIEIAKEKN